MGISKDKQQQQQQQQQQHMSHAPVRLSKHELRLPGDVDPDLMETLLQVTCDV